jgi:hypothetical protein
MNDDELPHIDPFLSWESVDKAFEHFWSQNQLGIDKNGKTYRTNTPRKRPKNRGFSDHNWMFNKKAVKSQVDKSDELI